MSHITRDRKDDEPALPDGVRHVGSLYIKDRSDLFIDCLTPHELRQIADHMEWDEKGRPYPVKHFHITKLERIDDGEIFSINTDDGTFSMDKNRLAQPTTFYRYTLKRLMDTGAFRIIQ